MASCSKRSYVTENLAVDALIEARIRFLSNSASTVYCCDDCGMWHLTSRGDLHPKLKTAIENGTIQKENRAYQWERKLR
ncbi:hypothetical protein [Lacihabitans lacunae]|uniref:Uncharacterized protein n=1 Tax=Lacihabitans lacunae TaxID=1028214 RepID=A0ABV7Z266_9BACT